jgi:hypothetical protein
MAAVSAGLFFLLWMRTPFYRGAALPLLLVGLLLGVVGYTVYKRSDADRTRNVYAFDMNPPELKERELPRMEKVMRNFVIYRWTEIILAVTGIFLFIYFRNEETKLFWKGLGTGLTLMALVALTADYFAEKRGKVYLQGLEAWTRSRGGS